MAAENINYVKRQIDEAESYRDEIIDQIGDGVEAQSQKIIQHPI